MQIRVEIGSDGTTKIFGISACEDLLHDYEYFVKQAKKFEERKSRTIFLHKRYLRAALFALFAYAEAVVNRWLYRTLERDGRLTEYEKQQWKPLETKIGLLDKAAIQDGQRARLNNAKQLRNLIIHLRPGRDAEFFDGLTLSTLNEAEQELKLWLKGMEPVLRMERHAKSAKVVRKLSRMLGGTTEDVSSKLSRSQ